MGASMREHNDRVVAILVARMGSERLPGKVLKRIAGKPALALQLERLARAREIDDVVVATSDLAEDDAIALLCHQLGHRVFRGSASDVLHRVVAAANWAQADTVVFITGDCVATCADVVDVAVRTFRSCEVDYLSNLIVQTYPQGVDVRVSRCDALERIDRQLAGDDPVVREHAYLYFEEHPDRFRIVNLYAPKHQHRPQWRLDLDYEEDLRLLRIIFGDLYPTNPSFDCTDLVDYLDVHPELLQINQGMARKPQRVDQQTDTTEEKGKLS